MSGGAVRVPFTLVDELGCWLDRPDEPNCVLLEAEVAGRLDSARLREAVAAALAAHPLARARRARHRSWHRRLEWEILDRPDTALRLIRWRTPEELAGLRESILSGAPPLESTVVEVRHAVGPSRDVVFLSAHHAALDGMSCLRLLRSVARRYAGRPDPVPADPLAVRLPQSGGDRSPTSQLRRPARIAADRDRSRPGYGCAHVVVPCRSSTAPGPQTVNDVLIVALAMTIAAWNQAHAVAGGKLRITMPINARELGPDDEPLGNLCRLAGIDVDVRDGPQQTLRDVASQTVRAKNRGGPQLDPVTSALASAWGPVDVRSRVVRLSHRLGARRLSDTSLVSNLGISREPLDFGPGARIAGLWFSTPAPMPRGLSLGAITVRRELHLCFRYRLALFDEAAANRFVRLFGTALTTIGDSRLGALSTKEPR
ncbi:hypothetical protein ACWEVP_03295 [Amycolatopsis sp. NPDC003865]